jgi:hypothetical protein
MRAALLAALVLAAVLFSWAQSQRDPPALESLVARLGIAALQRTVDGGGQPRAYLASGSPQRALRMLAAAAATPEQRGALGGQCYLGR